MVKPKFGEKIPYDPLWKGPLELSRRKTDPGALKFYLLFLLVWLITGIFAFGYDVINPKTHAEENDYSQKTDIETSSPKPVDSKSVYRLWFTIEVFSRFPMELFRLIIANPIGFCTIVGCSLLAAILSVMFIGLVRVNAKIVTWVSICSFCIILLLIVNASLSSFGAVAIGIINVIMSTVMITIVAISRQKINISAEITKEASKSVLMLHHHFLLPCCHFPLSFTVLMFFANNIRLLINAYKNNDESYFVAILFFLHFINFFGWAWTTNFIEGVKNMILSGSCGSWYWTMNKKHVPDDSVKRSIATVREYHLGTVAFGSIIISIFQMIQSVLQSLLHNIAGSDEDSSTLMKCFSCCCENFVNAIMYLSRNAYIMCAIHGTDFYTSGKDAFNLIKRRVVKVLVTTQVTSIIFTVGEVIVIGIPMLIVYLIYKEHKDGDYIILISFLMIIAMSFSILDILFYAIETVFLCVLEDQERNDGSKSRPYYMSDQLKTLMIN